MSDTAVTHIWMAGVILIMVTYGIIAAVGFVRKSAGTKRH
jgi:hypothetical protein